MRRLIIRLLAGLATLIATITRRQSLILPPTPALPTPAQSGYASLNGLRIWFATFGDGEPVILLHGGLANSNYWGHQVQDLARRFRVIVMDSRGHGRSTRNEEAFSYHGMASDVIALMDALALEKAAIVGWSDGAIIGMHIAIHYPMRLTKLFAFAANSSPDGVANVQLSPALLAYVARAETEYESMSPTMVPYEALLDELTEMWNTEPNFTAAQLRGISTRTWIVDATHDEAIKPENAKFMANEIPDAVLLLQPDVGHFSFLQNPRQFTSDVIHFLDHA